MPSLSRLVAFIVASYPVRESSRAASPGAPKEQPSPEPLRPTDRAGRQLWKADATVRPTDGASPGISAGLKLSGSDDRGGGHRRGRVLRVPPDLCGARS